MQMLPTWRNAFAVDEEVGVPRKRAGQPVRVPDGHGADLHRTGRSIAHAVADAFAHGNDLRIDDARVHAHGRLQVDETARLGARVESVEGTAHPDHVEVRLGVANGRRGVGRMHDAGLTLAARNAPIASTKRFAWIWKSSVSDESAVASCVNVPTNSSARWKPI